ncbi:MAG: c-type cytochrome [Nitrospirae bacterium]|nr:c-type cytochrome [Nitrospirota bacterium]
MNSMKRALRAGMIVVAAAALFSLGCSVDGAELFQKEGCVNCHRYKGVGGSICPDLTDVSKRRSDEWIRQQIRDSSVNFPDSTMPGFGHLSDKEIQAIIDYLKS